MRAVVVTALTLGLLLGVPGASMAQEELSTTDRLDARRYVAAADEAYVMGFQDGSFQAQGWHITGEMGGVWSQPLKLVDGVWFGSMATGSARPRSSRAAGATSAWTFRTPPPG